MIRAAQLAGARGKGSGQPEGVVDARRHSAAAEPPTSSAGSTDATQAPGPVEIGGKAVEPGRDRSAVRGGRPRHRPAHARAGCCWSLLGAGDAAARPSRPSGAGRRVANPRVAAAAPVPGGSQAWNLTLPPLDASALPRARGSSSRARRLAGSTRSSTCRSRSCSRRALAPIAFIANGGLQLGSLDAGRGGRDRWSARCSWRRRCCWSASRRACTAASRSRRWSRWRGSPRCRSSGRCYPADSWVEANRTLAYLAAFAAGIAAVRLARDRWPAVLAGVLLGARRRSASGGSRPRWRPAWLAPDEIYGRLREPYGYWNAVGVTAAMGDAALPLARHARGRPPARERARLAAARPASPSRCC